MFAAGEAAAPGRGPAPLPPRRPRGLAPPMAHLLWEGVLLLTLVVLVIVVSSQTSQLFTGPVLWWVFANIGLVATALAFSLRMRSPNLAVTGIAGMAGAVTVWLVNEAELSVGLATFLAVLLALVVGLGMGLVAGASTVPAWAVSLAGLALTQGVVLTVGDAFVPLRSDPLLSSPGWWVALFLVLSLGGGVLLGIPAVRTGLAVLRRDDERDGTAERVDTVRLLRSVLGLGGSSLVAAFAGVAAVSRMRGAAPDYSLMMLLTALAVVLIGGVAVSGRRAGFAGTVLGTALMSVVVVWMTLANLGTISATLRLERSAQLLIAAVVIVLGFGVSLLLEVVSPDRGRRLRPPFGQQPLPFPTGGPAQYGQPQPQPPSRSPEPG